MDFLKNLFQLQQTPVPNDRIFIEEEDLVRTKINSLKKTSEKSIENNTIYTDTKTRQKWELYYTYLGDDITIKVKGVRIYPSPKWEELLLLAIETNYIEETKIISRYIRKKINDKEKHREKILDILEINQKKLSHEKYDVIYSNLQLGDKTNKRETMNIPLDTVKSDNEYFQSLVERADRIKTFITTANSGFALCGLLASLSNFS